MTRFIWEGCHWVSNVPSLSDWPWKKSNYVFNKAKTKVSVQSFCFLLKLMESLIKAYGVTVACCMPQLAARPAWLRVPWQAEVQMLGQCITSWAREGFFVKLGFYHLGLGKKQEFLQNNQSTSQDYGPLIGPPLTNNPFSRLD